MGQETDRGDAGPTTATAAPPYEVTQYDVKWAIGLAQRYANRFPRLVDEFESEALVALAECAARYDERKHRSFRAFAAYRVGLCFVDVQRHWNPKGFGRRHKEIPDTVSVHAKDKHGNIPFYGIFSQDGPVGWEEESQDEIRGLARRLPVSLQPGFRIFYQNGVSRAAVARRIDRSPSRVTQVLEASRAVLEKHLRSKGQTGPGRPPRS